MQTKEDIFELSRKMPSLEDELHSYPKGSLFYMKKKGNIHDYKLILEEEESNLQRMEKREEIKVYKGVQDIFTNIKAGGFTIDTLSLAYFLMGLYRLFRKEKKEKEELKSSKQLIFK